MRYNPGIYGEQREYTAGLNQLVIGTEVEQNLIILFMSCSGLIPTHLDHKKLMGCAEVLM